MIKYLIKRRFNIIDGMLLSIMASEIAHGRYLAAAILCVGGGLSLALHPQDEDK